jgi:hypothetical protein
VANFNVIPESQKSSLPIESTIHPVRRPFQRAPVLGSRIMSSDSRDSGSMTNLNALIKKALPALGVCARTRKKTC